MGTRKAKGHKDYDAAFKELVEKRPMDALAFVGLTDVQEAEIVDADTSSISSAADKVVKVNPKTEPYLAHVEFQSGPDSDLLERLFWYNGVLFKRHRLAVWTVLVLLTRAADHPRLTGSFLIHRPDGRRIVRWEYDVVRVWETPVEKVLSAGLGVLPLAPLCDEAVPNVAEVIGRMDQRLRKEASLDDQEFFWSATFFLMGLRYDRDTVDRLIPGGANAMKESVTYQAVIAEGLAEGQAKGLAEGLAEGLAKGQAKGLADGLAKGRAEGAAREARKMMLVMGRPLLGNPSPKIISALEAIGDTDQLEKLASRLSKVSSWQALLAESEPGKQSGRKRN